MDLENPTKYASTYEELGFLFGTTIKGEVTSSLIWSREKSVLIYFIFRILRYLHFEH